MRTKLKFSSFFKNVVIELDKDAYGPDNHLAEWHRTDKSEETDGFTVSPSLSLPPTILCLPMMMQVTRPGEETVKCTILLLLHYQVDPLSFCCSIIR